ncbi:MAG: hypothetical protein IJA68_01800 [Clostridia bacterium]|nr:hypothetical protein [Clostridia bacterium]
MNILCVCTGNICRSPMMEYLLAQELSKHGIEATVCGAGTATMDDVPPSDHALTVMNEIGIDMADHRSRQMTRAIADAADVCVVMTPHHGVELVFQYGVDPEKVLMPEGGVPDPYGGTLKQYRQCRDQLLETLPKLIEEIKAL